MYFDLGIYNNIYYIIFIFYSIIVQFFFFSSLFGQIKIQNLMIYYIKTSLTIMN